MHITKDYDERKSEFLNTAMGLFMTHGYESTSVNMIIEAVGVSKGAFYHYFKTKEDLLDELAAVTAARALEEVKPIVEDPSLSALEKLNEMFARTNSFKAKNREFFRTLAQVFYGDSNIMLRNRMTQRSIDMVAPLMEGIITQGNREGSMKVKYPRETAVFILKIGSHMPEEFARKIPETETRPGAVDEILRSLQVYTESVERILAVNPGDLSLVDDSIITVIKGE